MALTRKRLADNLKRVTDNVADAAARARRSVEGIRIVAVTKSVEVDDIRTLVELGQTDLAENRSGRLTQQAEAIGQWLARRRKEPVPQVRWHMVGHVQRNKVKQVLAAATTIHSLDSLRLAEDIDRRAGTLGVRADVLLQVNCSEEPQKSGVAVAATSHMAELICTLEHLRLLGLMTMAPLNPDPEKARPTFVRLREVFEEMLSEKIGGKDMRHLSMGMSQDYQVAVEEGATMMRIGTALFQ